MASCEPTLGQSIHEMLVSRGLENPIDFNAVHAYSPLSLTKSFDNVCEQLGLSAIDPSTTGTPARLAKMYKNEICWGLNYNLFPSCLTTPNDMNCQEIILVRNIEVKSLCEHHFMPVIGRAHIAYIPGDKLLGLSKFNRIVEFFSRRPQLQERLCEQIAATLSYILDSLDVAVIIEAEHFCVKFRGIQDDCSDTVTSRMLGKFFTESSARSELLSLIALGK